MSDEEFVHFYFPFFVHSYIDIYSLTEGKKCEQKCAKKWLCAICIVGEMGDIGKQDGYSSPDAAEY